MANPPTGVPPRGGARPQRKRPNKRGRRSGFSRRYLYGVAGVIALAMIAVIVVIAVSGGSSHHSSAAIGWKEANGTPVYGKLGPENVPLELGPQLASPNASLTGTTIDGIQCGSTEQLAYHHHIHLSLFVNGAPFSIPLGTGMVPPAEVVNSPQGPFAQGSPTCLYWIHVHAQDGIVHIESPEARDFVLGQFFDIWHVALSSTQLGDHTGAVTATVDGQPWTGDPREIPMSEHADITINLGTPLITPPVIDWSRTQL